MFLFFSPQAIVGDRIVGAVGNEAAKGEAEGEKNLEMWKNMKFRQKQI